MTPTTQRDLGPLLAAVGDEWERGLAIAERAGIDPRTAGPRLAALEREGMVAASWTDRYGGVRLYRRGPKAPPRQVEDFDTPDAVGLCPDHGREFYVPLSLPLNTPFVRCPQPGCAKLLVLYKGMAQ